MRRTLCVFRLSLFFCITGSAFAQTNNPMSFFEDLNKVWEASPPDTSFISQLQYSMDGKEYFVSVTNKLLSKNRKPFSYYEGVYFFNPSTNSIEFCTVNKNEMHSGYCKIAGDTLFHYAKITGVSQIKAYVSAIIRKDAATLLYYATYGQTNDLPELKFEQPLIYRKIGPAAKGLLPPGIR